MFTPGTLLLGAITVILLSVTILSDTPCNPFSAIFTPAVSGAM